MFALGSMLLMAGSALDIEMVDPLDDSNMSGDGTMDLTDIIGAPADPATVDCEDAAFLNDCISQAIGAGACGLVELRAAAERRRAASHDEALAEAVDQLTELFALSMRVSLALSAECKVCGEEVTTVQ